MNSATILCPDKTAVGQVGVKNDKIDGSSNFNNNIFSHFEKDISLMEKSFAWYFQLRFMSIFTTRYLTLSIGQKSLLQQSYWYTIDYVISKVTSLAKCYCLRSFIYNKIKKEVLEQILEGCQNIKQQHQGENHLRIHTDYIRYTGFEPIIWNPRIPWWFDFSNSI